MRNFVCFLSPVGEFRLGFEAGALTSVGWPLVPSIGQAISATSVLGASVALQQLYEYFSGHRTQFDLPMRWRGTPFQEAVWRYVLTIPYGQTRTYGEVAQAINNSAAARAVGNALHQNPLALVVPCHRVVGRSGRTTGFAGGLNLKEVLLGLEHHHQPSG